jgi:hypothetical protein
MLNIVLILLLWHNEINTSWGISWVQKLKSLDKKILNVALTKCPLIIFD